MAVKIKIDFIPFIFGCQQFRYVNQTSFILLRSHLQIILGNFYLLVTDFQFLIASGITDFVFRSEEHTSELQSRENLVCRLLLEKKKKTNNNSLVRPYSPVK